MQIDIDKTSVGRILTFFHAHKLGYKMIPAAKNLTI